MINISPQFNIYKKSYSKFVDKENQNSVNLNSQPTAVTDMISFKGYSFSKQNRIIGKQIVRLIKKADTIAILPHKCHDADAIGSAVALARQIKEATGKIADIFIEKPLQKGFKFIDPKHEIKVVSDILGTNTNAEEIVKKFGKYDLVIGVDTANKSLFDPKLFEAFMKTAKKTVDIDHHAKTNGTYADITLTDTTKKSASQLIMEFLKPLGLNPKRVSPEISDPIAMGLVGDSDKFVSTKKGVFKDAEELSKTSNLERIITILGQKSADEIKLCSEVLSAIKISPDGQIAYCVFDTKGRTAFPEKIVGMALAEIYKIEGVKYFFGITKNSTNSGHKLAASVRSCDDAKPIKEAIESLGGGGHDHACGLHLDNANITAEDLTNTILKKLEELKNS